MRGSHLGLCLLLFVAACASTHPVKTDAIVDVKFGYWNSYSSASRSLSRENCRVPGETFRLAVDLPPQRLETIGETAMRAGFFSAKTPLPKPRPDNPEAVQITAPCAESTLGITHKGESNTISWSCNTVGGNTPPKEANDAYNATLIALQPYVTQLPDFQCALR